MQSVVITGISGYIGSKLLPTLDSYTTSNYNHSNAKVAELADIANLKAPAVLIDKLIESRRDGPSPRTIKNYRWYLR